MQKIKDINILYNKLPLEDNLVDALHGKHDFFELIVAEVTLDSGVKGTGYTYTGGIGGTAIATMLEVDLKPRLIGKELCDLYAMNKYMNTAIHYVARGGIASFAISALDIAFWDAQLKSENKALADVFGTRQEKVQTYHGGIDLMFTQDELLKSLERQIEKGHNAVKIKVGQEDENKDIERMKAVRNMIGKDKKFGIDANMVWSVEKSIRMAKRAEEFDLFWFEEPTNPDDYEGYAEIGRATSIPIAMGENLHSKYEHKLALDIGKIQADIVDASNVCGITGCFEVAKILKERGMVVHTHGMQELHVNILGALDNAGMVEFHSFPIHDYCVEPMKIENGLLTPSTLPGTGVVFDWDKINKEAL